MTPKRSLNPELLPPDVWKKTRDRISKRVRRNLHITETNPGPDSKRLRYDYVLTAAEVTCIVEDIMRDVERTINWHMRENKR